MNENALATELLTQINEVKQDFKIAMEEYNHQQKRACDAEAERDALAVENARLCDDLLSAQGTLLMIREYLRGEHSDTSAQDMIDEIARALESETRHE